MPIWHHHQFFWLYRVSLVKFSYWSNFHANIMTGSGVMTIFLYKELTRNRETGNTPLWVLPDIWRLGRVRDTKFDTIVSNKSYWMLQNARVTAFKFLSRLFGHVEKTAEKTRQFHVSWCWTNIMRPNGITANRVIHEDLFVIIINYLKLYSYEFNSNVL